MNARTPSLLLGLLAAPVYAHHSFAPHFDIDKPVDISGTVTQYEARNPHSYLHIAAVDENGKTTGVRVRVARLHAALAQRHHARRC